MQELLKRKTFGYNEGVKIKTLHPWNVTPLEAVEIQRSMRELVSTIEDFDKIERVAGVDVNFNYKQNRARAAVVVLGLPGMNGIEEAAAEGEISFPYIPGLFAFREIPLLVPALEKLKTQPHLVIVNGQGMAHPERVGLASHLGVLTDTPTIGCARSRFIGTHEPPPKEKGAFTYLYDNEEVIGAVVRTRTNAAPLYVSIGHRVSLSRAVEYVLKCTRQFRLPEPLRAAHRLTRLMTDQ